MEFFLATPLDHTKDFDNKEEALFPKEDEEWK